jgi:hypothetical protein
MNSLSWEFSNSNISSTSYARICVLCLIYWVWGQTM